VTSSLRHRYCIVSSSLRRHRYCIVTSSSLRRRRDSIVPSLWLHCYIVVTSSWRRCHFGVITSSSSWHHLYCIVMSAAWRHRYRWPWWFFCYRPKIVGSLSFLLLLLLLFCLHLIDSQPDGSTSNGSMPMSPLPSFFVVVPFIVDQTVDSKRILRPVSGRRPPGSRLGGQEDSGLTYQDKRCKKTKSIEGSFKNVKLREKTREGWNIFDATTIHNGVWIRFIGAFKK